MIQKLTHEEIVTRQARQCSMLEGRFPVSALLNDIRSLYNVGSMFRTADGANLEKLYLAGITGTPPARGIAKTALGAEERVPWQYAPDADRVLLKLREGGTQILVLEQAKGGLSYTEAPVRFPCCLVVGNELTGVDPKLVALSDCAIEIPMFGIKNSLNASVAFGVAAYELVRRWLASP